MSHSFHQLYYHFAWATDRRLNAISREWRPRLLEIIHEEAERLNSVPLRHNAMPDHVHLLVRLPPTVLVSDFIGKVKGASSFRANKEIRPGVKLHWQVGYGVVTIRKEEVAIVSRYIDNQEEHHRSGKVSDILERCEWEEEKDWP